MSKPAPKNDFDAGSLLVWSIVLTAATVGVAISIAALRWALS